MIKISTNYTRKYRLGLRLYLQYGKWRHNYTLVGAQGGLNLHFNGPHEYDGMSSWSSGLEYHNRNRTDDRPPDHDFCWLLKCPCWHDGTSLYAEEIYLPMFLHGQHDDIFSQMIIDADKHWVGELISSTIPTSNPTLIPTSVSTPNLTTLERTALFNLEYDLKACTTGDQIVAIRNSQRFINFIALASVEQVNYLNSVLIREFARVGLRFEA